MSHDEAREEAREFLSAFLVNLQTLDQTNRILAQVGAQQVQQQQTLISQLAHVSAQLDGVAQRCDLLEQSLGALYSVLGDPSPIPMQHHALPEASPPVIPRRPPGNSFMNPSFGQALGGVVGMGVDQLMRGGGGRQRR